MSRGAARREHDHQKTQQEEHRMQAQEDPGPGRRRRRSGRVDARRHHHGVRRLARRRLQLGRVLPLLQQQPGRVGQRLHRLDQRLRRLAAGLLRVQGHGRRQGPLRQEPRRLGLQPQARSR
nr:hypothetical protein [Angustibacter aerolatus]